MRSRYWISVLAGLFLCAGAVRAAPALEAYGRLPTLSDVTLSPDGKTIAYARGDETGRLIVVEAIGATKPLSVLNIHDQKLRSLRWADNSRLLITASKTALPLGLSGQRSELATAQYLDIATNSLHRLLDGVYDLPNVDVMNVVEGIPQPRIIGGHTIVFVTGIYFPDSKARFALFRQDLTTGVTRMVSHAGDTHAEDWSTERGTLSLNRTTTRTASTGY
jgi:hypothetical protein